MPENELIRWLKELLSSPILSSFIGIMGLILAIIGFVRPSKKRKLCFSTRKPISLGSEPLYKSRILIWNGGSDILRGSDIAANDPLRIDVSRAGSISAFNVVYSSSLANGFGLVQNEDWLRVVFDYVEPMEGCVIEIISSLSDGLDNLHTVKGTVIGGGNTKPKAFVEGPLSLNFLFAYYSWIRFAVLAVVSLALLSFLAYAVIHDRNLQGDWIQRGLLIFTFAMIFGASPLVIYRNSIPASFKKSFGGKI